MKSKVKKINTDFKKSDVFLVYDLSNIHSCVGFDDFNSAYKKCIEYVQYNLNYHIPLNNIVMYCIKCRKETYPYMTAFITIGEIFDKCISNNKCSVSDILNFNLEELMGV